jgi:glycosyltransferase involved in cell wall biosynthesis
VGRRDFPLSRRRADLLFFRAKLPVDIRWLAGRADVLYSPDFTAPPARATPRIVTIHDLAFLTHPEWAPAPLRRYLSQVVPEQVRRANAIAVVSAATRQDVLERLDVSPDRVHLVHNGVEDRFFSRQPLSSSERNALSLPEAYLLMVGTLEPRKNHLNVFRALDHLPSSLHLPLVVAGKRGWNDEPILAAAAPMVDAKRVALLDYVPEHLLPSLYTGASAVIYPSWTEGFGLPVLEALAAGVPVVTSTAPALREVGGDQVVYAEAGSPESIANAIQTALVADNDGLRNQRQVQARRFSWNHSGAQLAELLRSTATRGAR